MKCKIKRFYCTLLYMTFVLHSKNIQYFYKNVYSRAWRANYFPKRVLLRLSRHGSTAPFNQHFFTQWDVHFFQQAKLARLMSSKLKTIECIRSLLWQPAESLPDIVRRCSGIEHNEIMEIVINCTVILWCSKERSGLKHGQ